MTTATLRSVAVAMAAALCLPALDASAQVAKPTPVQLAQLPQFCYKQFGVPGADGPEYTIHDCGPGMNHYCGALLYLVKARGYVPNKQQRLVMLANAEASIRYSQSWSKDYLSCPLKDHMAQSLADVHRLQQLYGVVPGAKK